MKTRLEYKTDLNEDLVTIANSLCHYNEKLFTK